MEKFRVTCLDLLCVVTFVIIIASLAVEDSNGISLVHKHNASCLARRLARLAVKDVSRIDHLRDDVRCGAVQLNGKCCTSFFGLEDGDVWIRDRIV